jgi:hypothetical protein
MISIRLRDVVQLPEGRDFMFISYQRTSHRFDSQGGILSHIIEANFFMIHVNNTLDEAVKISKNPRLGILIEYEVEGYYVASSEYSYLVPEPLPSR